jgi:hypothetical protein
MRVLLSRFVEVIRRLPAIALVLWLAGLGCFLGCEMSVSAATGDEHKVAAQADSCPAFTGHDCCHKVESKNGKVESKDGAAKFRQTPMQMSCCPLANQFADAARKVKISGVAPAAVAGEITFAPRAQEFTPQPARRLQVPDRGSTHLRCCVFLI